MKTPKRTGKRNAPTPQNAIAGEYHDADTHRHVTPADASWFERPENVKKIIVALVIVCVALVAAEFFYTNHHPHFGIESSFAFQAWFGFVTFVVIVFLGRMLRLIVSRPEDYYDRDR
ncbi:hypothetical protein [Neorhodopirellula pilleata]|uniref:Uncharacterized protein n=1 Tax=Neorhodopirellula pilleata TaxID=2714738 RepID=A0A5C6AWQ8_9BACT|nr:hypothetical protein [Neorhodopirellula pilleata]TWU03472.1 hypothetical protein Pla100_03990 [Neorhodopirellula pilleata]